MGSFPCSQSKRCARLRPDPDIVRTVVTDRFIDSGPDVVLALMSDTNEDTLKRAGLAGQLEEINRAALAIARDAAADASKRYRKAYPAARDVCNT